MHKTKIEWTETSWNPITGCTKISKGCENCYAERMAKRLKAMGNKRYKNGFNVTIHNDLFCKPYTYTKPTRVFVNSMSDFFHSQIPVDIIQELMRIMADCPQHIFQILTKRAERLAELSKSLSFSPNIWMGVTVESAEYIERIELLKQTGAKIKFVSFEPLITKIPDVDLSGIDWIIVGGESGPGARPMEKEWVIHLKELAGKYGVHFFFKQWGGVQKHKTGRILNGRTWDAIPEPATL